MQRPFYLTFAVLAALAVSVAGSAAFAQECTVSSKDPFDLEEAEVIALYECIGDQMAAGYAKQGDEIGSSFRSWTVTSTRPAVTGPHGNRFLQTFANDIAAEQYLKFAEEDVVMPVGSILAKESFSINKKKMTARIAPLFIMTKLEAGGAPEAGDWFYSALSPSGKPMKIKQAFCSACHVLWQTQDYMGYPGEDVRVSN
jgi:Cytochrome P460